MSFLKVVSLFILFTTTLHSQSMFDYKNQFLFGEGESTISYFQFTKADDKLFYSLSYITNNDNPTLVLYQLEENKDLDSLIIKIPRDTEFKKIWLQDIAILKDTLHLLTQFNYYQYDIQADTRELVYSIPLNRPHNKLEISENNVLLSNIKAHKDYLQYKGNMDAVSQAYVSELDKTRDTLITKYYQNPKGYKFIAMGRRDLFSVTDDKIAFSDVSEYNINIFDKKGNAIDNITHKPDLWFSTDTSRLPRGVFSSSQIMKTVKTYKNKSFISSINFINNSDLLVMWDTHIYDSTKSTYNILLIADLWRKSEGEWSIVKSDTFPNPKPTDTVDFDNDNNLGMELIYKVVNSNLVYLNMNVLKLSKWEGKTFKEFWEAEDNYIIDNQLRYSIYEMEIKWPN